MSKVIINPELKRKEENRSDCEEKEEDLKISNDKKKVIIQKKKKGIFISRNQSKEKGMD